MGGARQFRSCKIEKAAKMAQNSERFQNSNPSFLVTRHLHAPASATSFGRCNSGKSIGPLEAFGVTEKSSSVVVEYTPIHNNTLLIE